MEKKLSAALIAVFLTIGTAGVANADLFVESGYGSFSTVYENRHLQHIIEPESFAYRLKDSFEPFLVKTGNNSFTENRYFGFENSLASHGWGVFSLSSALQSAGLSLSSLGLDGGYTIDNLEKISHSDQIGGAPVPEPQTMLLFGTGLAGLAGLRLRRKK